MQEIATHFFIAFGFVGKINESISARKSYTNIGENKAKTISAELIELNLKNKLEETGTAR